MKGILVISLVGGASLTLSGRFASLLSAGTPKTGSAGLAGQMILAGLETAPAGPIFRPT
jgi:hypothetical protein